MITILIIATVYLMHTLTPLARHLVILSILALLFSACGATPSDDDRLTIVVTTTILGDIVKQIVQDDAAVEVLLPIGTDPHNFEASSRQVASIHSADLVIANGLGLEHEIEGVLDAAIADGVLVLRVAEVVGDLDSQDPHVWLDPYLMAVAVELIGGQLDALEGQGTTAWYDRASQYSAVLRATGDEITDTLSIIPSDRRLLVTNHDSLSYFAQRFDFEVIGTVFPGVSPIGEPSSGDLSDLVSLLKEYEITTIFGETTEPSALAQAVGDELGSAAQVIELHTGSLGVPGSGAETYLGLLTTNAELIAQALGE